MFEHSIAPGEYDRQAAINEYEVLSDCIGFLITKQVVTGFDTDASLEKIRELHRIKNALNPDDPDSFVLASAALPKDALLQLQEK